MQNEISNVDSEDDGPEYGGGGHEAGGKDRNPWQEGLWIQEDEAQERTIIKSLW